MSIEKQLEEILKTYTLKWYENQKHVFLNHKDYDKKSNKIISIMQDDSTDGDPDRVYTNYYDLETFLVYPLTSSIMGTNNAVFLIYNLIIKNTNSLVSMTEKNMFATKTFYFSKSFLERNQYYKFQNKEYKSAIDRLIIDLKGMIFKKFVDTEKLTDFIKIKNNTNIEKLELTKEIVEEFITNLSLRTEDFVEARYYESFNKFLRGKQIQKTDLNLNANALTYIIVKFTEKFNIDLVEYKYLFDKITLNGEPYNFRTFGNCKSNFNKNKALPKKPISAERINTTLDNAIKTCDKSNISH